MKKRALSLFLALVLVFSLLPVNVLATEDDQPAEIKSDDYSMEGTTSLGKLMTHTIESADASESGFTSSVTDIAVTGTHATVELSTDRASELVVAVYPEEGTQMLGSGHTAVAAGDEAAEVNIEIDQMPEYFVLGAYLLDAETREPLSEQYISRYYTQEFQDFLATDTSD
ncbi:MAG: hypothetical protein IKQ10_00680 [Oscillospiraceae bacterium]|nr:hypothetical protein [Oscillospiraceae bacterium]